MLRRPVRRALAVCALVTTAVCVLGTAPAAAAPAPVFTGSAFQAPFLGDVTGDGITDRVQLGQFGDARKRRCVTRVFAGTGQGHYAPPILVTLPLAGQTLECPDLGTVLAGPDPTADRLAVGFFFGANDHNIKLFSLVGSTPVHLADVDGLVFEPSFIGSQDFDGDGWGDLWEMTDQGEGFIAMIATRDNGFRSLTSLPSASFVSTEFADLDHGPGIDMLLGTVQGRDDPAAVVVDGRTGTRQVLASAGVTPAGDWIGRYTLSVVDLDHDNYPDIRVDAHGDSDQIVQSSYWRNRCKGGDWKFVPAPPPVGGAAAVVRGVASGGVGRLDAH